MESGQYDSFINGFSRNPEQCEKLNSLTQKGNAAFCPLISWNELLNNMRYPFVLCLPIRNQHQLPASDSIQPNPSTECYSHKGSEKLTINRRVFEGSQRYLNTRLKCKERERNLISTKEQKLHIKEYNVAYNLIGPKAIPYASLKGIQFETNINKILSRVTACSFHF